MDAYLQGLTFNIAKDLTMLLNRAGFMGMLNVLRTQSAKLYQLCTDPAEGLDVPLHSKRAALAVARFAWVQ